MIWPQTAKTGFMFVTFFRNSVNEQFFSATKSCPVTITHCSSVQVTIGLSIERSSNRLLHSIHL